MFVRSDYTTACTDVRFFIVIIRIRCVHCEMNVFEMRLRIYSTNRIATNIWNRFRVYNVLSAAVTRPKGETQKDGRWRNVTKNKFYPFLGRARWRSSKNFQNVITNSHESRVTNFGQSSYSSTCSRCQRSFVALISRANINIVTPVFTSGGAARISKRGGGRGPEQKATEIVSLFGDLIFVFCIPK